MLQTKLSSKGQVIIPKPLRTAHNWQPGQQLIVIDTPEGVLLKPAVTIFSETSLEQVAGCLHYKGKAKTLEDMEKAIVRGAREQMR